LRGVPAVKAIIAPNNLAYNIAAAAHCDVSARLSPVMQKAVERPRAFANLASRSGTAPIKALRGCDVLTPPGWEVVRKKRAGRRTREQFLRSKYFFHAFP
jgi:hypothetical protein